MLRRRGLPVAGLKPFETGCQPEAADAAQLSARGAQRPAARSRRSRFATGRPLSPAAAAETGEGLKGTLADALKAIERASAGRIAIIERWRGDCSFPSTEPTPTSDLARALDLPVVLVGRNGLGTLNHTTLSVEALRSRGLKVEAVVLSARATFRATHRRSPMSAGRAFSPAAASILELPRTSMSARASVALEPLFEGAPFSGLLRAPTRRSDVRRGSEPRQASAVNCRSKVDLAPSSP